MATTLKMGNVGDEVFRLQRMLELAAVKHNRPDFSPRGVDGKFGSNTQTAVRNFQAALGLTVDGIVGDQTWSALQAVIESDPGTIAFYSKSVPSTPRMPVIPSITLPPTTAPAIDWKVIGIGAAIVIGLILLLTGEDERPSTRRARTSRR
jgi:hypothetical protein